jgi:hypothetical protein
MTSWAVWAGAVAVALLIGFTATHFSARTLRSVTAGIVIVLIVAVTAYGQTPAAAQASPSLETAFAFGADRLAGAWFRPLWALWSSGHAPAPGRLGWLVIAVVLLLGYRQAEKWALRRQAPGLDTSKLTEVQPSIAGDGGDSAADGGLTAGQRHDWLAAELKFRLSAIDVYAPPILPGGTRSDGLASIAEASGVTGANLAAAIIRFLGPLWPAPRRFELSVWVEGTPQEERRRVLAAQGALAQALTAVGRGGAERARRAPIRSTRVTVEIDEPGTGVTVASKTIVAASIDDAASMVAGYVARQIFARDPVSPPWCYGAADGRDLGALGLARQDRVYVETAEDVRVSRRRQIEVLSTVTGADRCAGIVRYELAQLWDLERDHFAALRLHTMNREQYPRFFRGTYRLCMSLEMIAGPAFSVNRPELAEAILDETLMVLYQAGVAVIDRCGPGDIHLQGKAGATIKVRGEDKDIGPYVLSHALREILLEAARHELRVIRQQLWFPVIMWNTFLRRDERAVWRPHWRLSRRQEFKDGVCAAEILVAVKHRLNERHLVEAEATRRAEQAAQEPATARAGTADAADGERRDAAPPSRATRFARLRGRRRRGASLVERFWQRKGLQVVAAISGDASTVRTVLQKDFSDWPASRRAAPGQPVSAELLDEEAARRGWAPPTRDRVRWLPWQPRTASWQAAYNTACLHALLLQQGLANEGQVIASLRRVLSNRDSGLERPYDWISNDPDFAPLLAEGSPYPEIRAFHEALERRDYPMKQTFEVQLSESRHGAPQTPGPHAPAPQTSAPQTSGPHAPGPASGQASLTE